MVLEDAGIRADGPPAAVGTVSSVPARSWTARRTPPRETPASSSRRRSWRVFWPPARRLSRGHVPGWETVLGPVCGRSATTSGPRRKGERSTRRRWQCLEAISDEYPGWRVPLSGPGWRGDGARGRGAIRAGVQPGECCARGDRRREVAPGSSPSPHPRRPLRSIELCPAFAAEDVGEAAGADRAPAQRVSVE
jgi:hypothetical protein